MNDSTSLSPRHAIPSFWNLDPEKSACLHLGENPFPPTDTVLKAVAEASLHLNRYPDTNANHLREKLAEYVGYGIEPKHILVGNGSDELIDLAVVTFAEPHKGILTFEPSFFVYAFAAKRHRIPVYTLPRKPDYTLSAFPEENPQNRGFSPENIGITFIANPNNPTGTLTPRERLLEWMNRWSGIIVVDECYYEFSGETLADCVLNSDRLVIFRSLSKGFGLAGLRLGYAIAHETLIDVMARHALTFPVNVLAQAAGIAALGESDVHRQRVHELIRRREQLQKELSQLGLTVLPSHANFLLVIWPQSSVNKFPAKSLAEHGIYVSDQTAALGLGVPALRIAVGTSEENQNLVHSLRQLLPAA